MINPPPKYEMPKRRLPTLILLIFRDYNAMSAAAGGSGGRNPS